MRRALTVSLAVLVLGAIVAVFSLLQSIDNAPEHAEREPSPSVSAAQTTTTTTTGVPSSPTAVPLIIDSDLLYDSDDVGALAIAFALEKRGEASVLAVGISRRADRPGAVPDSWKCADAIARFYRGAPVPLGAALPDDRTSGSPNDFVAACAARASATDTIQDVVGLYRRVLAAQPDGTVVVTQLGFSGNLARLLASPPDPASPLDGRELVARKVRQLVVMGGGYPSFTTEFNLAGDPVAAQEVSSSWPTRIVWSGWEVGSQILTGSALSATHPESSPVRAAYEGYAGVGKENFSWDLTVIYHAVRPDDPLLRESDAGVNQVDTVGGNVFVTGAGNQAYLLMSHPLALHTRFEELLAPRRGVAIL